MPSGGSGTTEAGEALGVGLGDSLAVAGDVGSALGDKDETGDADDPTELGSTMIEASGVPRPGLGLTPTHPETTRARPTAIPEPTRPISR
jgi:hypothetical protein